MSQIIQLDPSDNLGWWAIVRLDNAIAKWRLYKPWTEDDEIQFANRQEESVPITEAEPDMMGFTKWDACIYIERSVTHFCGANDYMRMCVAMHELHKHIGRMFDEQDNTPNFPFDDERAELWSIKKLDPASR